MHWIKVTGWTLVFATGCGDDFVPGGEGTGSGSGDPTDATTTEAADDTATADDPTPTPACELDDSWLALPAMSVPRSTTQAIRLDDGTVLVPGGVVLTGSGLTTTSVAAADRFDPATNTWAALPDVPTPRSGHGLLPLADGDVLVVGGWSEDIEVPVAEVERFDLETSTWQPAAPLPETLNGVLAAANGDLRVVLGRGSDGSAGYAWVEQAWQPISVPANVLFSMDLLPFGAGFVLAGTGVDRAMLYDPASDEWLPTPDDVAPYTGWLTDMSDYVQGAALLGPAELFVLATTGGSQPDIEQQGVAARLSVGATSWQGGAPGPFLGDTNSADALGFSPGWVLIAEVDRGEVYDAATETWCLTAEAPSPALGAAVVLEDGSVLFAGGPSEGEVPLRWTAW